MYYHLQDHIYVSQFRDEFILLDSKADKYVIYPPHFSKLFQSFFQELTSHPQDSPHIQKLLNNHIIQTKEHPYPFYIDRKLNSNGVSNVDWRLPLTSKEVRLNAQVLKVLMTLIKVNFYIMFKGLYATIQLIKKSRKNHLTYTIPSEEELNNLANMVNKACFLYPTRTKCLEWAITFVLIALEKGWKCNLEIGIQNYPFFAHAWVECDGKTVTDSPDLREGLAIILNEPFRRLKP
ncbi:lasso peptide biosynthesis B2 protein [Candidatus Paracaedibacter symbiosus]|uniref:lasso peptide biosynthesis B2 protein n=1 Tax=Candidatus Paracaedibacter symbiosus TaxID=244582 RepID=UPI000509A43C|nr:lasso peptide biosynthesis B2 protein [Candidatus Paracaedibacter symbiosus]